MKRIVRKRKSIKLTDEINFKKEISLEAFIFLALFIGFFAYLSSIMGATNMIKTMMMTSL